MAAAQQWARRPWYARAWFTWPRGWQAASTALLVVMAAGAVMLPGVEGAAARVWTMHTASIGGDAAGFTGRLEATMNAVVVLWRTIVRPLETYAFGFVALMCSACAVFGAALNHVVFGRTVQP